MVLSQVLVAFMEQRGVSVHQSPDKKGHIAFRKCQICGQETPATEIELGRGKCPDCYVRKVAANKI